MDAATIMDRAQSHAAASGLFDRPVGIHEPKNAPGRGLTCAIWVQRVGPVAARSGLATTSARVVLNVRLYMPMLHHPADETDPILVGATDTLMTAYSGDFTLGGAVAEVDLLGAYGVELDAVSGYLAQDSQMFRIVTITLPLILNDQWPQAA